MNAFLFGKRIHSIMTTLISEGESYGVTSPRNGLAIQIWMRNGIYCAASQNNTAELFNPTIKGDLFTVKNAVMRLAGY